MLLLAALVLASQPVRLKATFGNAEKRALNKRHKEQRKELKAQQRNMKKTLRGHALAKTDQKRFNQELKVQRRMLKKGQKDDAKNLKARQAFARKQKRTHPS